MEMDELARVGDFFDKDKVSFMKQAAANVGGIHIHGLGNELTDGTRSKNPQHTGIMIIRDDDRYLSLDRFWSEVRRLEAESKKPKGLLSRFRLRK